MQFKNKIFHFGAICFLSILCSTSLFSLDYKIVPTLSSNPTSGTGVGVMSSIVYNADETSSPSQTLVLASYTNSDSYNVFGINNMFFDSDRYVSNTIAGYVYNNSEFDLSADIPINIPLPQSNANFQTKALILNQQLLYMFFKNLYMGVQASYVSQSFHSSNELGTVFLLLNGIEDSQNGSIGVVVNYDTRSKNEKLYPRNAIFATLTYNNSPEFLGNKSSFSNIELDLRKYIHGFKSNDVFATQLYAKASSDNTPDGSLATLGLKNVLRGFSIGQYKARNLVSAQSEYRYTLEETNFVFTSFLGLANLSGGSTGTDTGSRDRNNGNYISGGIGMQYVIQKKAGVNYRVDLVTTNKNEQSIYATVNQAF